MAPPAPPGMKRILLVLLLAAAPALAQDARTAVPLDAAEREHVLAQMRGFLSLLEKSTDALARNDFDALAALRPAGERMPPGIAQKLPPAFRKLAMSTHQQIDTLTLDAAKRDARHSLDQISRLLQTCNACHAAYRF
jgi:hypothetical protein